VLQSNDTGLEVLMKTQDHLRAPLLETHLRSKDQTNYKMKGRGLVPYTSKTEKQTKNEFSLSPQRDSVENSPI